MNYTVLVAELMSR